MLGYHHGLDRLQKVAMSLMAGLVVLTFLGANLQALFWQSSQWLVGTVLPAVVVDLTNEQRAQESEAPLTRSSVLDRAAQMKAEDMAKHSYFSHYSPTGVSPWHWFDEAGYVYAHAGENLAVHFTDSKEVVDAWMNSPTHRENIVGPQYTEIGVGTAKGTYEGYDTVFVVQLFGAPAVVPVSKPIAETPAPKPVVVGSVVADVASLTKPAPVVAVVTPEVAAVTPESTTEAAPALVTDPEPAPVSAAELETSFVVDTLPVGTEGSSEVVMVESELVATSSGLAVAQVTTPNPSSATLGVSPIATQPNTLLQLVYMVLGSVVFSLLVLSIVLEARRAHVVQVTYGILLLLGMGALWYANAILTSGAVVA